MTLTSTDFNDTEASVDLVVTAPKIATSDNDPDFPTASTKGNFVAFTLDATGVTAGYDFNTYSFYVRGEDGTHYSETISGSGFGETVPLTTLQAGEKLHGVVVYDIPTPHGTLVFTGSQSRAIGEWHF